jgi:hypothetical protein
MGFIFLNDAAKCAAWFGHLRLNRDWLEDLLGVSA